MLSLRQIKNNPQILEFIKQSDSSTQALGYTEHGFRHGNNVSKEAQRIAKEMGFKEVEQELAGIAGFCHDMGNFFGGVLDIIIGARFYFIKFLLMIFLMKKFL